MTNWALSAGNNREKYQKYTIEDSKNHFGGTDYAVPFS
jgi:hypothetical protein